MIGNSNHLISEKSPYLLQHARNPVNWYPWGAEAFKKAELEDKPVFLSIGYSTCHWCHVMEKESFEDIEVASLLNDTFVSIKVDREERPDIDKIYMDFCQMLTGSGGWPLTIIMTPDKKPFFAATYIPKDNKYGRTGMLELIPQVKQLWLNKRNELLQSSENISRLFLKKNISIAGKDLDKAILDLTFEHLSRLYDAVNGGFGLSPKFPTMHHIYFLLRYWKRTKNEYALKMAEKTLNAMRSGGIWDHAGFGFHRYSTDKKWIVPHFEKMLYDQALASMGYIEAYQATQNEEYRRIAEEIFTYVLRDMTSGPGGFYSAEDADSEGVEGKFYTWTEDEIGKIFSGKESKDSEMLIDIFNIGASSLESGSILYVNKQLKDIAVKYNIHLKDLNEFMQDAIKKMFYERKKRIHPFKDDKILTDWNALMISAFAMGARVFENSTYEKAAVNAADFIINNLISKEGVLLHRYRDGQSAIPANLDDYAFFIMGLVELYQTTFDMKYLKTASALNKYLIENFWDNENGGFFFTGVNNEISRFRKKDVYDGAIPSGNSVALLNLIKLSRITADTGLEDKVLKIIKAFSETIEKNPEAYTQFISSFDFLTGPSFEIVIVADNNSAETKKVLKAANSAFVPNKVVILKTTGSPENEMAETPGFIKDLKTINNKPTIYVCSNYSCKTPTNDINEMLKLIN
ncbi:MAG: thioredoxin domain-containing protein [Actinobacteria bacterium]|nr:thioredoxin domain-containing protein [Actinomycetota bacterium]